MSRKRQETLTFTAKRLKYADSACKGRFQLRLVRCRRVVGVQHAEVGQVHCCWRASDQPQGSFVKSSGVSLKSAIDKTSKSTQFKSRPTRRTKFFNYMPHIVVLHKELGKMEFSLNYLVTPCIGTRNCKVNANVLEGMKLFRNLYRSPKHRLGSQNSAPSFQNVLRNQILQPCFHSAVARPNFPREPRRQQCFVVFRLRVMRQQRIWQSSRAIPVGVHNSRKRT